MSISNKNVLLIAPTFFDYRDDIRNELELLGVNVYSYNERPSDNPIIKAIIRKRLHFFIAPLIKNYYKGIINDIEKISIDYIFIVNPEVISCKILKEIKSKNMSAKTILYLWDSMSNKPYGHNLFSLFDNLWSFDERDCNADSRFKFLPLFFNSKYSIMHNDTAIEKYDLCFIGTIHSDRYNIIKEIRLISESLSLSFFSFMYLPSRFMFFYKKIFDRRFRNVKYSELNFSPLCQDQVIHVLSQCKVVIDINHHLQDGLTSRTFEVLAAQKKLITTNDNIVNYDLYDKSNIDVIDRKNPKINLEFVEGKFNHSMDPVINQYSLRSWVCEIFKIKS